MVPVYAAWALPTAGWLLLCSAWAKSKPFLWAIMIPVFAGIFVTWFDLMQLFYLQHGWFWMNIVGRALGSLVPGSWMPYNPAADGLMHGPETFSRLTSIGTAYHIFATPQLWIGAAAGAAMIFGAIRLRRWRDDN
jgi:ABC-2 type transport system permease protein